MKPCKYCKGKYTPTSFANGVSAGCSFECAKDIKASKKKKGGSAEVVKFSSFSNKPRKGLQTKTPLKSKSQLKTKTQLKGKTGIQSKPTMLSNGGSGTKEARAIKQEKKVKAQAKLAITPAAQNKPNDDLKALRVRAKTVCHLFIRERDFGKPCPCCGQQLGEGYHAGHFMKATNTAITFCEFNIHGQRRDCNMEFGGDRGCYEDALRVMIGDDLVDWLKQVAASKVIRKYTAADYKAIIKYYEQKLSALRGIGEVEQSVIEAYQEAC